MAAQPGRTIPGDADQAVRDAFKLILPVKQVGAPRFDDDSDGIALRFQSPGDWVDAGDAITSPHAHHVAKAVDLHRVAQRAGYGG